MLTTINKLYSKFVSNFLAFSPTSVKTVQNAISNLPYFATQFEVVNYANPNMRIETIEI